MRASTYLFIGTALTAPALVFGQTAAPQNPQPKTRSATVEEVVVTARLRTEKLKNIPVAVTALSGKTLKDKQVNTVKDIAAYVPGLTINSDGVNRAFISIRGVGTTLIDTVQPGVGIFLNGVYEPDTSYLQTPLVDVERVEVLKGPQGTLFGNNTLGGAINVITRPPGDQVTGGIDGALAGPDGYKSVSGFISGPIIPGILEGRLAASDHDQNGFQYNTLTNTHDNPLSQKSLDGTLRFSPLDWAVFTLNGDYDRVHGGNTPYFDTTGPYDYTLEGQRNLDNIATLNYKRANLTGVFDVEALATKITSTIAYDESSETAIADGDYSPIDFLTSQGTVDTVSRSAELRADTQYTDRLSSLVGIYGQKYTVSDKVTATIVPYDLTEPTVADSTNINEAIFGNLFYKLTPTIDLSAGLRYDVQRLTATNAENANGYSAHEFEPRFTFTKHWTPDIMTYLSVARGVRGGGENGPGAPNPVYHGDAVWTYEGGAKFSAFDNRLSVDTDVFYNDYSNFIGQNALAPSITGVGFVAVNLNSGQAETYGWEAELHARPTQAWRIDAGITLLHARVTNDNEFMQITGLPLASDHILFVPDWNFNAGTSYTLPVSDRDNLVFAADVIGKGSRLGSSLNPAVAPFLRAYILVNPSITWQHSNVALSLFATNIFDTRYVESYLDQSLLVRAGLPPPIGSDLSIQGDRRRVGVRASYRF